MTLVSLNAAPYVLGDQAWPSASDLPQRLIALPPILHLPPSLGSVAAWTLAALAILIAILVTTLSVTSYTPVVQTVQPSVTREESASPAVVTPATDPRAVVTQASAPRPAPPASAPPAPHAAPAPASPTPASPTPASPTPAAPAPHAAQARGTAPRVFISHSSANNAFGLTLAQRLKDALGSDDAVFYDSNGGLMGGDEWPQRLQLELGERDVFVLILSPQARDSGWVQKEWNYALRQEVSIGGKVIVPVMLQETPVWPFLADYQIVDFTKADQPGQFDAAFDELLAAVRLGHSRKAALRGVRGERRGPPFDLDRLPLPEPFIGRGADIEWALERLAPELSLTDRHVVALGSGRMASRLASIAAANGLAGIGKSALAGIVARILYATNRYPDGIAVVRCNDLDDPIAVLRAALARFDPEEREPRENSVDTLTSLAKRVFSQLPHALIVLDNVEPKLPVERVTTPLRVAGAALLLTSRQRLPTNAAPAGDSRELDLLTLDEAVAVFIENRERPKQTFAQAEAEVSEADRDAIAGIATALGRHTLAVKLAAARAKGRDLARLARDYAADPRLGVNLKDGLEAVDVVLSSSVASLPSAAQTLFVALGAFASDDIGREALLAVGATLDVPSVADSLDSLLDLRLADGLTDVALPDSADRERLRLHPLVHAYASDLLDATRAMPNGERWPPERRAQVSDAMAEWYADYANATSDEARLSDETNITGALAWAETTGADRLLARISDGMMNYWEVRSRTEARKRFLPLAVEAARRVAQDSGEREDRLRAARLELADGALLQMLGDLDGAKKLIQESLQTRVKLDDLRGEGIARSLLGDLARQAGDLPSALDAYQRVLAIMQQVGDLREEGVARSLLGDLALQAGDLPSARDAYQRVLAIMQQVGDLRGEGVALFKLAQVLEALGALDEAEDMHRRSLAIGYRVESPPDVADSLLELGRFLCQHGRGAEEGRRMLAEADSLYTRLGPAWQWQTKRARDLLDRFSGDDEQ